MSNKYSNELNKDFDSNSRITQDKNLKMSYGTNHSNDDAVDSLTEKLNPDLATQSSNRPTVKQMLQYDFYQRQGWLEQLCEGLFKVHIRGSTIKAEIYYGIFFVKLSNIVLFLKLICIELLLHIWHYS